MEDSQSTVTTIITNTIEYKADDTPFKVFIAEKGPENIIVNNIKYSNKKE